jgi:hypothetical protein
MMFCKSCGKEIPDNSVFCNYCGTRQIETNQEPRKRKVISVEVSRDQYHFHASSMNKEIIDTLFDELSSTVPKFSSCMKIGFYGGNYCIENEPRLRNDWELWPICYGKTIEYLLQNGFMRTAQDGIFDRIIEL